jgi:RING-box protein 1
MADNKPTKRQRTTRASARASDSAAADAKAAVASTPTESSSAPAAASAASAAPAAPPPKPGEPAFQESKPFIKMKKWNAVAVWSWNVVTDTCAICRNNLHEPRCDLRAHMHTAHCAVLTEPASANSSCSSVHSIDVQAMGTQQVTTDHPGLSIAWGACGHIFHLDCIKRWLRTRSVCPLCNREWELAKTEQIHGYALLD